MESTQNTSSHTTFTAPAQDDGYYPDEEVTEGNWKTPKVEVKDVKVVTGEENETTFWSHRAKLYRWKDKQWKERGVGEAKLLKHKETGKIRFLLRQDKTLKIVANHYVFKTEVYCNLSVNVGSDRTWVWAVMDYAEDHVQNEQFALRFGAVEQAQIFKEKFDEACAINMKIMQPILEASKNQLSVTEKTPESKDDNKLDKTKQEESEPPNKKPAELSESGDAKQTVSDTPSNTKEETEVATSSNKFSTDSKEELTKDTEETH